MYSNVVEKMKGFFTSFIFKIRWFNACMDGTQLLLLFSLLIAINLNCWHKLKTAAKMDKLIYMYANIPGICIYVYILSISAIEREIMSL